MKARHLACVSNLTFAFANAVRRPKGNGKYRRHGGYKTEVGFLIVLLTALSAMVISCGEVVSVHHGSMDLIGSWQAFVPTEKHYVTPDGSYCLYRFNADNNFLCRRWEREGERITIIHEYDGEWAFDGTYLDLSNMPEREDIRYRTRFRRTKKTKDTLDLYYPSDWRRVAVFSRMEL